MNYKYLLEEKIAPIDAFLKNIEYYPRSRKCLLAPKFRKHVQSMLDYIGDKERLSQEFGRKLLFYNRKLAKILQNIEKGIFF